jgi:hypothetical protein
LIAAVAPFTVKTGTAAAYVTTPEDAYINEPTLDYVAGFVPNATGKHFNPPNRLASSISCQWGHQFTSSATSERRGNSSRGGS